MEQSAVRQLVERVTVLTATEVLVHLKGGKEIHERLGDTMIYATGDLHGNALRFQPEYFPEQAKMTKDDYMIVCGDFGCIWNGDKSDDPQLDRLEALPFTVLFVDGNHENFDALNEYPVEQWHGGKVHKIRPHVIHLMRGQAFELQGRMFFTMGGAQSHDIADGILDMDSPDFL